MTGYEEVEIKDLVKVLFQQTYGVDESHLYIDEKMCEVIRDAVVTLRKSYKPNYKNSGCESAYNDEELRKAYMISYYPYYFAPLYQVAKNVIVPKIDYKEKIFIDCFAGGPCPEIYGLSKAFKEDNKCSNMDVVTYDLEYGWFPYQKFTAKFISQFIHISWLFVSSFDITKTADIISNYSRQTTTGKTVNFSERWSKDTDIFILQNYLSHLNENATEINNFMKWFENLATCMKTGAFFVCIDLNYNSAKKIFTILSDLNFLQKNNLQIINAWLPINGQEIKIRHEDTLKVIKDKIFIGQIGDGSDLVQKKNTKFYYVVLQKN